MTRTQKLGLIGTIALALACRQEPVNPDTIRGFASCQPPPAAAFEQYFGKQQSVVEVDVTGDGTKDMVYIYGAGYVFYGDGRTKGFPGCDTLYRRIDTGTPEAQRLLKDYPLRLRDSQGVCWPWYRR